MNITNLFKIALKAIGANKMRSFLTMLGIIIGVSSVIIMLALGHGAKETIKDQISDVDPAMIFISPGPDRLSGVKMTPEMQQTLTEADYKRILEENKYLTEVCPRVFCGGQLVNGNNNYTCNVTGVNGSYLKINGRSISNGTMFDEADIQTSAKVCVIGQTLVDELFAKGVDPVGSTIRINNIPVTVIGVVNKKGRNAFDMDQDEILLMPYTTVMKRMLSQNYYNSITATASNQKLIEVAKNDIASILRENHNIKDGDIEDFTVEALDEEVAEFDTIMNTLTLVLSLIAGISLLVGGIGIMNIMYVSVTERTREIGLRMSVGARTVDIMSQFLIEAILISVTGGLIGVLIGGGISYLARYIMLNFTEVHILIAVEPWTVLLSFAICTVTGIFFGWYPAKKAANLDPIDALRYE